MTARLIFLSLTLTASAAAQNTTIELRPGSESLDVTHVRAGLDSLGILIVEAEEAFRIGTYVIETAIEGGLISRSDRMLGLQRELLWGEEVTLEDGSLRLLALRELGDDGAQFEFGGEEIRRSAGDDSYEEIRSLTAPLFHPASLDFVLRSLPLDEDYEAALIVFEPTSLTERSLPIRVTREVAVTDLSGTRAVTWEVHVDIGGAVDVYHIEQDTGSMVRYESAADNLVLLRL